MLKLIALLSVLWSPAHAADPSVEDLLNATDDIQRGASSVAVIEMAVKTSRYERTVKLKAWSKGEDKSLIVIEAPTKDKGIATLKSGDNIWNYLPKVDRVVKVPAGMMSGSMWTEPTVARPPCCQRLPPGSPGGNRQTRSS